MGLKNGLIPSLAEIHNEIDVTTPFFFWCFAATAYPDAIRSQSLLLI